MYNRIIRIAAALAGCILFATGCIQKGALDTGSEAIRFAAGSALLRNDAPTKSITENFTYGATFVVFGEKVTSADVHTPAISGTTATFTEGQQGEPDYWTYTPLGFWNWTSRTERYDFVAVSPADMNTAKENAVGNLSVTTHYDYLTGAPSGGNKEDILAATYRRTGTIWEDRFSRVDLSFSHMGSAVGVMVENNSQNQSVTITSIRYKNLIVSADAKVSIDNYGNAVLRWTNITPDATPVREQLTGETTIAAGSSSEAEYQVMIPQNLSLYHAKLVLTYKIGDSLQDPAEINLEDITRTDGTAITSWDMGTKYTYAISMRLDGGLLVTVTTTPWDEPVAAETPGILI